MVASMTVKSLRRTRSTARSERAQKCVKLLVYMLLLFRKGCVIACACDMHVYVCVVSM